jgi:hypothetical protein
LTKPLLKRIGGIPRQRLKWKLISSSAEGGGDHFRFGDITVKVVGQCEGSIQHRLRGGA